MKKSLILVFSALLFLSSFEVILCSDMNYIQNKGQWVSEILFTSQRDGLKTSVTNSGIYFDFFEIPIESSFKKRNLILSPCSYTSYYKNKQFCIRLSF